MDLFLLKKIIGMLLMPINIIALLLILSIILFKKAPNFSFKCLVSASLLLILSSTGFIADLVMKPLENQYNTYTKSSRSIDYILVLGLWPYL